MRRVVDLFSEVVSRHIKAMITPGNHTKMYCTSSYTITNKYTSTKREGRDVLK